MKQKLNNSQVRILLGLSKQREEIQKQAKEVQVAEKEYMDMLIKHYSLEDGEYKLSQQGNEVFIIKQENKSNDQNVLMEDNTDMEE